MFVVVVVMAEWMGRRFRLIYQPVVIVIVCHAIATDGGVGGVLDHGLCVDRSVALTLRD